MNDVERFDRLWREAEAAVARLIRRVGPLDEREDLLVETRLSCWRAFARFDGEERAFRSLACKVAHRLCLDRWRRKPGGNRALNRITVSSLGAHDPDPSPSPYERASASLGLAAVCDAIARLPKEGRDALVRSARGETFREIGESCGLSTSRAYQVVADARSRLAALV